MTLKNRLSLALDRRTLLAGASTLAAAALTTRATSALAAGGPAEVSVDELMKTGDLPDIKLGPDDAKVTIVEYASMTCGHCKHFHDETWPKLKAKYIDTGKVRFIFREFPLDARAFAASMLARCAGGDKTLPLIDVLFDKQQDWAFIKTNRSRSCSRSQSRRASPRKASRSASPIRNFSTS